uniref:Uncharacterized protein n=1 Tax=Aegilops tauschii TaxID=37682 RepID=M8BLP6_AEGTA
MGQRSTRGEPRGEHNPRGRAWGPKIFQKPWGGTSPKASDTTTSNIWGPRCTHVQQRITSRSSTDVSTKSTTNCRLNFWRSTPGPSGPSTGCILLCTIE